MGKFKDISGKIFGNLTVIELDENHLKYPQKWKCKCDCGNIFSVLTFSLTSGATKNCKVCGIKKTQKASNETLINLYKEHQNIWKVAEILGMCGQSVHERLKKLNIELNNKPFTDDEQWFLKKNYEDYATRGRLDELAKEMNRSKTFLCKQAKKLGLKTDYSRKKSLFDDFESRFKKPDMYKNRPHPKGMAGKKHTTETKELLSKINAENQRKISEDVERRADIVKRMIATKHQNGNLVNPRLKQTWKAGWREIGGKRKYFRSRWEANYARYLQFLKDNKQILEWEHEAKVFYFDGIKRGCVSFLPDFQVTEISGNIVYHEVKGWMDDRSKTKIKRMGIYFPDVVLKVIDAKWFKENNKNLTSIIYGWET